MSTNPFPAQRCAALLDFEQATVEELRMLLHERNVGIKERGAERSCEYGFMARAEILCLVVAIRAMRRITRGRPWPEGAHAREDVPALVARVRELEKEIAAAKPDPEFVLKVAGRAYNRGFRDAGGEAEDSEPMDNWERRVLTELIEEAAK